MRSVLAQLDDAPTVQQKQPLAADRVACAARCRSADARHRSRRGCRPVAPKVAAPRVTPVELTPVQALKVLETQEVPDALHGSSLRPAPLPCSLRRSLSPFEELENQPDVPVMTPEDTQTLRDIKLDKAQQRAAVLRRADRLVGVADRRGRHAAHGHLRRVHAVQRRRQPQGRKWYGLRLGFFSDPNSATQVANYVRADYRSVAVVPVANKERDNAMGIAPVASVSPNDSGISPPQRAAEHLSTNREAMQGFELVNDDRPVPQKRDLDTPAVNPAAKSAQPRDPQAVRLPSAPGSTRY